MRVEYTEIYREYTEIYRIIQRYTENIQRLTYILLQRGTIKVIIDLNLHV